MLTRLRAECGTEFANKCEIMLKDLQESDAFMAEYRRMKPAAQSEELEHHVHVLSQSSWPITTHQTTDVKVPPQLAALHTNYTAYYKARHQGKALTFALQMATAILKASFSPRQTKQLEVSGL